jgi:hypothetical protein
MSDGSLSQLCDKLHNSAKRDATQMITFGVNDGFLAEFSTRKDAFANLETDEELSGYMMIATQNKNLKATDLRVQIRQHRVRVVNLFGENSAQDKMLGIETLSRQTDEDLARNGKRVHRVLSNIQEQIAVQGVTPLMLSDFLVLVNAFDAAIDAQDTAIRNRDIAVDERVKAGNELYNTCIKIASAGKAIFEPTGQAQYNDYVITESSPRRQQVSGVVNAGAIVNPSVIVDNPNDIIHLQNTGNSDLIVYISQNPADEAPETAHVLPAGQTQDFIAQDLGFTDSAQRLLLYNNSKQDIGYKVEVV